MKGLKGIARTTLLGIASCACAVSLSGCDAVGNMYGTAKNTVLGWFGLADNTYTVTYETNGGTQIAPQTYETKGEYTPEKPADPTKKGYDFAGWYLDESFSQAYDFDTALNGDVTLYAFFTGNPYTVTYQTNGAGEIAAEFLAEYEIPTRPEDPVLEGVYFAGWYLDEDFEEEYEFDYALGADSTLYAYFSDSIGIATAEDLMKIAEDPTADYILIADVNLSGAVWEPIESFSGELDGNGHKIYYFAMSEKSTLSGFIQTNNGVIKDLTIEDVTFASSCTTSYVSGALVGENNGTIENCVAENLRVSFKSNMMRSGGEYFSYVGGLVGRNNEDGVVSDCEVNGEVEAVAVANNINTGSAQWNYSNTQNTLYVGGAVCENYGFIENTVANVDITSLSNTIVAAKDQGATASVYVGGLVGLNYNAIGSSVYEGDIILTAEGVGESNNYVGGFVGQNFEGAMISECFAIGSVLEEEGSLTSLSVGGFTYVNAGNIKDCYADVAIVTKTVGQTDDLIGGFVALNKNTIGSSYASGAIETLSAGTVGGFVADLAGSVITGCIASGSLSLASELGFGEFVGNVEAGALVQNCYYAEGDVLVNGEVYDITNETVDGVESVASESVYTSDVVFKKVYWSTSVWTLESGKPTLVWENK